MLPRLPIGKIVKESEAERVLTVSLDAPTAYEGGRELSFHDVVSDADAVSPETLAIQNELTARAQSALARLPSRLRFVVQERTNDKTLQQIGVEQNLSRERIRQLERGAITELRKSATV